MSSKNNNTASQALLEMNTIISAIKDESKKTLSTMLDEAVRNVLREECCKEDDEYEVVDDENEKEKDDKKESDNESEKESSDLDEYEDNETEEPNNQEQPVAEPSQDGSQEQQEQPIGGEIGPEEEPQAAETGDAEANSDEWDKYAGYQVADDTYDLTGENDKETVAKVYKLLTDDDNIIIRQDGDTIQLTDNEAGTEYVIDLGTDNDEVNGEENAEGGEISEMRNNIACFKEGAENDFEYNPEEDGASNLQENHKKRTNKKINESKQRRQMKENKQVLFEVDLGYTDSYQDKDPIVGLSNDEPSKTGKSWHKGVPTGTKKPWAGPSKTQGDPFKETVNEEDDMNLDGGEEPVEEGTNVGGAVQQRSNSKSHIPNNRKEHGPFNKRHVSTMPDGYDEMVAEAKKLKAENKKLKEAIDALKSNLNEAYVTNVNLGKITKLFLENTTSQKEKIAIVNRFCNEAKTVKDSEKLYESINNELQNKKPKMGIDLNGTSKTANGTKQLNESVEYRSNDLMRTIDLMTRVNNY